MSQIVKNRLVGCFEDLNSDVRYLNSRRTYGGFALKAEKWSLNIARVNYLDIFRYKYTQKCLF